MVRSRPYAGPARYLAPCVAALLLGSTTGLADGAPAPDARLSALRTAKRSAVLELYALESSLARARTAVAENARRQEALDTAHRRALVRATVIRRSLATTQQRITTLLRRLYVEGSPEPVAVLLGARSLPAVLEGIDGLERATRLNRRLATEAQLRGGGAPAGARRNLARADGARRVTYGSRTSGGEPRVRDAGEAEHDRVTQPPREPHERAGRRARGAGEGRRAQVEATDAELLAGRGSRRSGRPLRATRRGTA